MKSTGYLNNKFNSSSTNEIYSIYFGFIVYGYSASFIPHNVDAHFLEKGVGCSCNVIDISNLRFMLCCHFCQGVLFTAVVMVMVVHLIFMGATK